MVKSLARVVAPEHRAQFARLVHVAEHYQAERERLEAELAHVMRGGLEAQSRLLRFVARECEVDVLGPGMVFDAEAGTIQIPAEAAEAEPASTE